MNYNHAIVEIEPKRYVLARQNLHSEIWSCGDVRSRSCPGAAQLAAKNKLAPIYPAIECAVRALFDLYPEHEIGGRITLASVVDARMHVKDLPAVVYVASYERPLRRENALSELKL